MGRGEVGTAPHTNASYVTTSAGKTSAWRASVVSRSAAYSACSLAWKERVESSAPDPFSSASSAYVLKTPTSGRWKTVLCRVFRAKRENNGYEQRECR